MHGFGTFGTTRVDKKMAWASATYHAGTLARLHYALLFDLCIFS